MSIDGILADGRAAAEARMRDTVRLYTQGADEFDRGSGTTTPGPQTDLYTGRARVKPVTAVGQEVQAGEQEVILRQYEVSLPWATSLPQGRRVLPGARIEVTTSPDTRMAGLVLYVLAAPLSDQATAWRISAEDRT